MRENGDYLIMDANYKRLAKKAGSEFGDINSTRYSLLRDEDHLLYVKCTGYSESYKRFYFGDIQAIVVQETGTWRTAGIVHGVALSVWLAFLLISLIGSWPVGLPIAFGICAAIACTLLVINRHEGPTCATYIYTAVQRERLYPLGRIAGTRRILAELLPLVNAAQGVPAEPDQPDRPLQPDESAETQTTEEAPSAP